ncbi:uncharacterized protein LOC144715124 [Wolffia australiana]
MESNAPAGGYAESIDSLSPRSRGAESWDDSFPAAAAPPPGGGAKLRLMCSYGGQIVPRPHDRSLCYLGGETRIVVVERHASLGEVQARLSSFVGGRSFCLKYQLPSEDLDSLISVTTDEDLENMIEEYDRIAAAGGGGGKPLRLRLFLFPAKPESTGTASSIGSLLDDSKSETWFVDALNSAVVGRGRSSADSAGCLLGLESKAADAADQDPGSKPAAVPDSPMLGTFSSFGSGSSAPSLSNLPPIRVRAEDLPPERRPIGGGLEEHFSQMTFSDPKPPPPPPQLINVAAEENPNSGKILPEEDKSDLGSLLRGSPQFQPMKPASPRELPGDGGARSGFLLPLQAEQAAAAPPLLLHHGGGGVMPMGHYYHQMAVQPQLLQDPHAYNAQMPMYFLPVRQSPAYSLPVPAKTAEPVLTAAAAAAAPPPLQPHQFMGYASMHPHARAQSSPNYGYEFADRPQQIFYTQTAPASALPPQYQPMNPADSKPGKAS